MRTIVVTIVALLFLCKPTFSMESDGNKTQKLIIQELIALAGSGANDIPKLKTELKQLEQQSSWLTTEVPANKEKNLTLEDNSSEDDVPVGSTTCCGSLKNWLSLFQ